MGFSNPGSTSNIPGNAVVRDTNGNAFANAFVGSGTTAAGAGTITTLTAASARQQTITGTLGQTFKLPDATTLTVGDAFYFNNNGSSGTLTVQNTGASTLTTVPITGYVKVTVLDNSTANGTWDNHAWAPSNATWGSTGLNTSGSFIVSTNSATALTIDTSQKSTFAGQVIAPLGSNSAPGFTFTGHTDTGLFNSNASDVNIATGGTNRIAIGTSTVSVALPLNLTGGNSVTAGSGTAITAGGTAGTGLLVSSTANFGVFFGSGVPSISAAQGSIYLRSDGSSSSTRLYINTTGSTTWTNVTTAT